MPKVVKVGRVKGKYFKVPDVGGMVMTTKGESLFYFGRDESNSYRICLGVGIVYHVEKGDELDIVSMHFGRAYPRRILVYKNHARRQIYTLKKGQLAWFYGIVRYYTEDGKVRPVFIAKGFQAWYVPKAMDIKHYNLDDISELEKENETSMLNFLDEILKLEGDDKENETED